MTDDADTICTVTFAGRLIDPPALGPDRWCVCWWDGAEERFTYKADRAEAEQFSGERHGIIVRLAALQPWPTRQQVIAASTHAHTPPAEVAGPRNHR